MLALFNAGNKAVGIMKAGQTFTIEPMINAGKFMYYIVPSNPISYDVQFKTVSKHLSVKQYCKNIHISVGVWNDRLWPDDWTAVTADGKRSAQFEHTLLVSTLSLS